MKISLYLATAAAVLLLAPLSADAAGRAKARGARANADGGVTAAAASCARGSAAAACRARGVYTDAAGNVAAASGACAAGASAAGCRAAKTMVNADGSATRTSGVEVVTATGSASTRGSFTRNADGTVSGARTTTASGQNGNYDAATTTNPDGSASRQVNGAYQSETGAASVAGSFQRNADGTYSGARTTSGANANGSYATDTIVSSEEGLVRSGTVSGANGTVAAETIYKRGEGGARTVTCTDASGVVVACPF